MHSVTSVLVGIPPRRKDRASSPDLFHIDAVTVRTYLVGTDLDLALGTDELLNLRAMPK